MSKMNSAMSGAATGAAVGGPWGAVIGGAAGYLMGSDDKSNSYLEDMWKQVQQIPLPVLKEMYPEVYQQVVQMNPELETAVSMGPSAMEGISTDPSLKAAQMKALQKLQGISDAGGRDAQFMADQARLESENNANVQAQQGAIMQNLAARGMSGGGNELVARQMAAQQGANRQAQSSMDLKAQAERRALDALMASGNMAGNMDAQSFNQQSQVAQAKDAINKFNTQNQQQVIHNNTTTRNTAQQMNAQNAQSVANANTQVRNDAQKYNLGLSQQQYNNQLAKYGLINNATNALADSERKKADKQDQFLGGAFSSAASAFGGSK